MRVIIFSQMSLAVGYLIFSFEEDALRHHLVGMMTANYQGNWSP